LRNFKTYMKDKYRKKVKKHYIRKHDISGNIEKGLIYIYEESLPSPEWVSYLNTLSEKKTIKVANNQISKAILFLTIKGSTKNTFAITFGNGSTLLDREYIVSDFGLKVSKSLLNIEEIISIDSTSIDRKIFNTKKQSIEFLMPEKLLEYGTQNVLKNVHGVFELNGKFSIGGKDSINFKGDIDLLSDLANWLNQFVILYTTGKNNLGIYDDLTIVSKADRQILDNKLGEKILNIINSDPITGRQTSSIKIVPNEPFDLADFNGFFISGLGYKKSQVSSDFFIESLHFFERLKKQLKPGQRNSTDIIKKIKTDIIYKKSFDSAELEPICTIYKSINFEISLSGKRYVLISGTWYEIDREFYSKLQKDIDGIQTPDTKNICFIPFDSKVHYRNTKKGKQLSEGKYNEDLALKNGILMLDREDYRVDKETMRKYGIKSQSSIELCDAIYFDKHTLQFVHVKRHSGGASGTSHLLTQALVSAYAFINDTSSVIDHINSKIQAFNSKSTLFNLPKLKYENQKKEVVLAIIDNETNIKKAKKNSSLLSLLEMISLRASIKNLEHLGFKCYLTFIPGDQ